MDNKLRNLLGLLDTGKRVYQLKDGEVTRADYEYCTVLNQVLFGDKGLAETLGHTWDMVHDPRFEAIERLFIVEKPSFFGGDSRAGMQRQQKDGTFDGQFAGIEQYAEILGEGRNMLGMLRSRAIIDAIAELYPDRKLRINERDSHGALDLLAPYTPKIKQQMSDELTGNGTPLLLANATAAPEISSEELSRLRAHADEAISDPDYAIVTSYEVNWNETLDDEKLAALYISRFGAEKFNELGVLTPEEKITVSDWADTYQMYKPHNFKFWPDDEIWKLLFAEYTNYFRRNGTPIPLAVTLFNIFKADLLGLIVDYAEVANVQETVLLEDTAELYDPEVHGEDADRVSMEVENLERALTYRAELRVTAYQILSQLGIASQAEELTDFERDTLLKIVYTSNFIDDKPGAVIKILGFLSGIKVIGQPIAVREFEQLTSASEAARKHAAGLKDGSIQPINRYTEETVAFDWTPEEAMIQRVLANPIAGYVFTRLTGIERRLEAASEAFSPFQKKDDEYVRDEAGNRIPEDPKRAEVLADWISDILNPDNDSLASVFGPGFTDADVKQLDAITPLVKAQAILKPVFEQADFEWTDDVAAEVLTKVEYIDPSPEFQVTTGTEGTDPGAPETWVN